VAGSSHFMEEEQAPHLPSKDKIGALASPPRSLATIHTTMVKTAHP
jgi:hypothetical protein